MKDNKETRTFEFRVESNDEGSKIVGHAAVFNEEARIFDFQEKIAPGAFRSSIKEDDVRALFNHDSNFVLGRNTAGTLDLKEDKKGLAIEIDPPDTQFARDLMVSMERGDITQMSFGFQVVAEEWEANDDGPDVRTLKEVRLFDVSPVTYPAYEGTDVAVRSHTRWLEDKKVKSNINLKKKKLNLRKKKEGI